MFITQKLFFLLSAALKLEAVSSSYVRIRVSQRLSGLWRGQARAACLQHAKPRLIQKSLGRLCPWPRPALAMKVACAGRHAHGR